MRQRPPVSDWERDFDHLDPRWIENPYPIWDKLRERCPIAPNGAPDCKAAAEIMCRTKGFATGNSVDYQTAGGGKFQGKSYGVWKASGGVGKNAVLSHRHYLADAEQKFVEAYAAR